MGTIGLVRARRLVVAGAALVALAVVPGCIEYAYPPEDPGTQQGGPEGSVADFDAPLANYGDWVDVPGRGRVWVPAEEVVGPDFVPYTSGGQWVSTDEGWVFESQWDNDWGWATYHYGRWYHDAEYGWAWVPDTVWGPAWVDWRYGGAYVGWAPLAPVGIVVAPASYVFVETRYVASPGVVAYRVPAHAAVAVYGTTASAGFAVRGSVSYSMGPPAAHVAAAGVSVRSVHYARPANVRAHATAMRARARPSAGRVRSRGRSAPRGRRR